MNYNRKIMKLELSAEKTLNDGYYYAELLLPAADYEIKDAIRTVKAIRLNIKMNPFHAFASLCLFPSS